MEDHEGVGHLVASAIMLINRINPSVCLIENVPQYADSASAQILRHHFRDAGYDVQETVLSAREFGCLENRNRWFLVAATRGIEIDLESLTPVAYPVKTISDIMDKVADDSPEWRTFDYLKVKEKRDSEKGNSFAMQIVKPESSSCPVIRKSYAKGGSTDPLLAHPSNPDLLRQFSIGEHSRIKEVPEHLVAGMTKTDGHALLGQGVAYAPVKALFKRIGECLIKWKEELASQVLVPSAGVNLLRATG
jgi:DNA (cytosine-5)-methyltransferase 1